MFDKNPAVQEYIFNSITKIRKAHLPKGD
jgi:hypothetical protein